MRIIRLSSGFTAMEEELSLQPQNTSKPLLKLPRHNLEQKNEKGFLREAFFVDQEIQGWLVPRRFLLVDIQ
jgi:hypothetical protein